MKYIIQPGHSFVDSDGTVKTGGQVIELSDDVARTHADKVSAFDGAPAQDPAQLAATTATAEA